VPCDLLPPRLAVLSSTESALGIDGNQHPDRRPERGAEGV
jgi:hypothetical protein